MDKTTLGSLGSILFHSMAVAFTKVLSFISSIFNFRILTTTYQSFSGSLSLCLGFYAPFRAR